MKEKFIRVLLFLKQYSGNQYRKQEKCATKEERQYMDEARKAGSMAREAFCYLAELIEKKHQLEHEKITQWQNSGTFASYFWCQMKRPIHKESPISLSLFAERANETYRFRISVELAVEKASEDDLRRYRRLLEMPLDPTLVYVSGGNNETDFRVLNERDNNIVQGLGLKKVQISSIINESQLDEDLTKVLIDASSKLISYYDKLFENDDLKVSKGDTEVNVINTKDALIQIKKYIFARGFNYPDSLIENYFLCIKSKPFVILAGTSGTGKTRLVKLFADAIGAEYKLISVRPDWSDGSDLFGHYDLNGRFIEGPVCECFKMAYEKPSKPVFLCLDEMNLARVEYYLSDFLSVIESREMVPQGKVVTTPIAQYEKGIPDNLYIVGTVNMDETTFPFSKKVLDRANTIEFSYVDLMPNFDILGDVPERLQLPNSFLHTEYLVLNKECSNEQEYVQEICSELQAINEILAMTNAHVGYRVRDEIVFYMLNNKDAGGLLPYNEAFDYEIMQKILPRIQGSSDSVKNMLCELFIVCAADLNQTSGDTDSEKMRKILDDSSIVCKYRKSAEKLEMMVRRFEEDGFTSYWL